MGILLKMAWRNVWRNKRRSSLTIAAIAFGLGLTILTLALAVGMHNKMIEDAVKVNTGHLQIHRKGFQDNMTLEYTMVPVERLDDALRDEEHVLHHVKRVQADALLSSENNTSGVVLFGVDPAAETGLTNMKEKMREGKYLTEDMPDGAMIGATLAKNLKVGVGDELVVLVQGYQASLGAGLFTVEGIYRVGFPEMDARTVFINLNKAQDLLSLGNRISLIAARLGDSRQVPAAVNDLASKLDADKYEVLSWADILPELVQFITFDNVGAYVYLAILLIVVAFGILDTILMAVFDRVREFGVMMAVGTKPRRIVSLVIIEAVCLALVGIIVGNVIGVAASLYFIKHPLDISSQAEAFEAFGVDPILRVDLTWGNILVSTGIILGLTILACIYPAIRASRFRPVEALRHV